MARQPRIGPKRPARAFIAEWREAKHLSQEQLADRLDVDKSSISRWEAAASGQGFEDRTKVRMPDLNVLAAIAEALDIPHDAIYRLPPDPESKRPEDQLATASEAVRREAAEYIQYLIRKSGT